jgi:hypothetical protein
MNAFTDWLKRIRLPVVRMPVIRMPTTFDIYPLIGAGAALLLLLLFYLLSDVSKGEALSTPSTIIALLIALSPLLAAYRVEQTTGAKIFTDFRDFSTAVAWFPLTIVASITTESQGVTIAVMILGYLFDPILLSKRRSGFSPQTRILLAYSRGLCGMIGTILVITFLAKLMDVGNPKNKKSLVQEILSVVMWGYIGKTFFDFIGVTKPINLSSIIPRTRIP